MNMFILKANHDSSNGSPAVIAEKKCGKVVMEDLMEGPGCKIGCKKITPQITPFERNSARV